jgi:ribosomal protein S18 acetylase RimI-like enzyme
MSELYHLVRKDSPSIETLLFDGINDEAVRLKGMDRICSFGICIEDEKQKLLGGATGVTYYGCLYVDMLWVKDDLRHQGWGARLMQEAEKIGIERRCTFATVNTMDWEALPFYQKLGYVIEFIREGFEKDSKLFMLRKNL